MRGTPYMLLPLYSKKQIVGFASVDMEDYKRLMGFRWLENAGGYCRRHVLTERGYRGRLLHLDVLNPPEGLEVDHIDRNPRNNRRENLRLATHAENHQNKGCYPNKRSRYRGVSFDRARSKWIAKHKLNGKTYNLGRFHSEEEAAEAAARFRAKHMPFSTEGR